MSEKFSQFNNPDNETKIEKTEEFGSKQIDARAKNDYPEEVIEKIGQDFHKEDFHKSLREYLEKNKDSTDPKVQENLKTYQAIVNQNLKDN